MPEPRPLFNLPALLADCDSVVYVVEGEKCVDALTALGLLATTSAGGSQAARLTDWTPLAGRRVVMLPDNDDAGRKYANAVGDILEDVSAAVRVGSLDGLAVGGDVADLYERCTDDAERQSLRELLESLANQPEKAKAQPLTSRPSGLDYRPFPVGTLPDAAAALASEGAAAILCDPVYLALPILTFLGAAIGNSRRLRLKRTYETSPILWTGIVGLSGTAKTPAVRTAMSSAYAHEESLHRLAKPGRFLVGDTTTESLAPLMAANPRGIFCVREELAGWFGSIDRYAHTRSACSADQAFLLSAYNGMPHIVDRRTGDQRHLHIPRASLWVTGGIQPGLLAEAMGTTQRESGLMARLLMACPPSPPQKYTDADVTDATQDRFDTALQGLFALEGQDVVTLDPEAKELWRVFHDRTAEEAQRLSDDLCAAWSKFRDTALRIALIFHLAESKDGPVSRQVMERALELTEWFKHEARRVHAIVGDTSQRRSDRKEEDVLLAWMSSRDWVTQREVERGIRCFRGTGQASAVLRRLVKSGRLDEEYRRSGPGGGPSTYVFRIAELAPPASSPPAALPPQPETPSAPSPTAMPTEEEPWTKL
jgi:hypothetical protein